MVINIEIVDYRNFDEVLPLIAEYQGFYNVAEIDLNKNRKFFAQFLGDNDKGILHLARLGAAVAGFSTIYFGFSSARAEKVAILNDLYVKPEYRRKQLGKLLIENAVTCSKAKGISRLQWLTAKDNEVAQKLYDVVGAKPSDWRLYALDN